MTNVTKVAPRVADPGRAGPPAGGSPGAGYALERRRLTLSRVRWAARLAVLPIALAIPVNVVMLPDRLPERLIAFAVEAALCLAALGAARHRNAERHAVPMAVAFVAAIGATAVWSLSLSPRDLDILVGPIAAIMITSALFFPWGLGPQVVVSVTIGAGYLLLPPWHALDSARITNILITLTLGEALSLVGAYILDRQRHDTFVERERVSALAAQRELLINAGRELNSTLELPELVQRITAQGRRLVGADSASLTIADEGRGVLRTVAASSAATRGLDDILGVEFSIADVRFLTDELMRRRVIEIPGGTPLDGLRQLIFERFGIARTLYVTIERDGRLLGFLNFSQQSPEPAFSEHQIRLAEGLAHQAAIALLNAQLVDDLQTANRIKSEFVSTMSHELRTPLHVIIGYTEMLDDVHAQERMQAIANIRRSSIELLELIEATLNVSRIEAGKDTARLEVVPVPALWEELAAEFAALKRSPHVELRWEPAGDVELLTDRRKVKIILKNLVGNALKFTPAGRVVVSCTPDGTGASLAVHDTGVGIDRAHLPLIFDMFRQVDSSDSRAYSGVGLGLYIVRRLVDQLGGDIRVDSEPGRGSTFTVVLPLAPAHPVALHATG